MKELVKLLVTSGAALGAGWFPLHWAYLLWAWCIAQVPVTSAYAGLMKIGVTIGLIMVGGGATLAIAFLFALVAGAIVGAVLGLFK